MASKTSKKFTLSVSGALAADLAALAPAIGNSSPREAARRILQTLAMATPYELRSVVAKVSVNALNRANGRRPKFKL